MKRGELYRVYKGTKRDPKQYRVFAIVSRQAVVESQFSTVTCAPVYSRYDGLSTQVEIGVEEGLKRSSSIFCDELLSIEKVKLTDFIGSLGSDRISQLNRSLKVALGLD